MSDHVDGPRSIGDPLRISRISSRSRAQRTPHAPFSVRACSLPPAQTQVFVSVTSEGRRRA